MSEENVEVVRRFIDAINRGDVDAWAAVVAPELEFQSLFVGIEGRTYRGPERRATLLRGPCGRMGHLSRFEIEG